MIDHLRSNKGKEFLYVLPIKKSFKDSSINNYTVCKVKIINIYNTYSECLIIEVINENPAFPSFSFYKKHNYKFNCSNKNLFTLYNKNN